MKKEIIEREDINFVILAINSHEKMYKLCWSINKNKKFNFKKTTNHINPENTSQNFERFTYINSLTNTKYDIVSNSCSKGFLDPTNKSVNYFFTIQGGVYNIEKIIQNLNELESVLLVFELNLYKIKSINPFIIND